LGLDVRLIIGKLRRQIDCLGGQHPADRTDESEEHQHDQENGGDAAEPSLQPAHHWGKQEGDQRREGDRNEDISADIKNGDDKGHEQNGPNADKRSGRTIFWRSHRNSQSSPRRRAVSVLKEVRLLKQRKRGRPPVSRNSASRSSVKTSQDRRLASHTAQR